MTRLSDTSLKILIKEFTADGLVIGKDFSFGANGNLIMSDAAVTSFLSRIPEEDREDFRATYFEKTPSQGIDLRTIAVNVGVHPDYFERLMKRVKTRITKHVKVDDAAYIMNYSGRLMYGTCAKFPEIEQNTFARYVLSKVGARNKQAIARMTKNIDSYPEIPEEKSHIPGEDVFIDILEAAAMDDEPGYGIRNGELYFSVNGLKTIAAVWEDFSGEKPMRELVAELDR